MITKKTTRILVTLCLLALLLNSCFLSTPTPVSPDTLYTLAAQTIVAENTLSAGSTAIAQLTQLAMVTPSTTTIPTATPPTATLTPTPTATPPPTYTPLPTYTQPIPTRTRISPTLPPPPPPPPCDWAEFIKDVTIPDGTILYPGKEFTKVWRLKNRGSCIWDGRYALVFVSGDRMEGNPYNPLEQFVYPGNTIDLPVDLVAPSNLGSYRGNWMLRSPSGYNFGIGSYAGQPFWVDIDVLGGNPDYALDFAASMCAAKWHSSSKSSLPCPGNTSSDDGFVVLLTKPYLENGRKENEPTLWTRPAVFGTGWIEGKYPEFKIKSGDHFVADIGCLDDSKGCDVTFIIGYQEGSGSPKNLGSWHEVYDGNITSINLDLTPLAGKTVKFILTVINNGKPYKANAFWFTPGILR